jgi:tetratricopeptide (TPR) repeat protein
MSIRKYHDLPSKTEDRIWELLDDDSIEAAKQAWDLIPEPKFKWGMAHMTLYNYTNTLNVNSKHSEAFTLLDTCIKDLEATGDDIIDGDAYINMGETLLYLDNVEDAKKYFESAYKIGTKRAFSERPKLYLEMAKAKSINNDAVKKEFQDIKNEKK